MLPFDFVCLLRTKHWVPKTLHFGVRPLFRQVIVYALFFMIVIDSYTFTASEYHGAGGTAKWLMKHRTRNLDVAGPNPDYYFGSVIQ